MSRTKIQRQGRKLHISNESTTRLHTSTVYPIKSSNGSTIIITGTETGLRVTWSGGKSLFVASQREGAFANGDHQHLNVDNITGEPESDDEALFDSDEEDLDDHQPYPSDVQEIDIALPSPVLHVAVPPLVPDQRSSSTPVFLFDSIILATACENSSAHVVILPLDPPSASAKRKGRLAAQVVPLDGGSGFDLPLGVALTWGHEQHDTGERYDLRFANEQTHLEGCLKVALVTSQHAGRLQLYSLPISSADGKRRIQVKGTAPAVASEYLDAPPTSIAFSTPFSATPEHDRLLLSDTHGLITIYKVGSLPHTSAARPQDTMSTDSLQRQIRLSVPYVSTKSYGSISQAVHKKILCASWVLSGAAILVLLEDGHVGLFALAADPPSGLQNPPRPFSFACEGFIGDAPEHASGPLGTGARSRKPQLAPMTPNTRRTKSGALFSEPAPSATSVSRGGIATFPNGAKDDAVLLWYGSNLFSIPSLRNFWAQSDRADAAQGSLVGSRSPIVALDSLDLGQEVIVDVALLPTNPAPTSRGLFGTATPSTQDILVTAEYRSIIVANARSPSAPQRALQEDDGLGRTADHHRLGRGELGLDGVDRLLDDMASDARGIGRRVGFTEA